MKGLPFLVKSAEPVKLDKKTGKNIYVLHLSCGHEVERNYRNPFRLFAICLKHGVKKGQMDLMLGE